MKTIFSFSNLFLALRLSFYVLYNHQLFIIIPYMVVVWFCRTKYMFSKLVGRTARAPSSQSYDSHLHQLCGTHSRVCVVCTLIDTVKLGKQITSDKRILHLKGNKDGPKIGLIKRNLYRLYHSTRVSFQL